MIMVKLLRTKARPTKIKTAIWVGEKQWHALKALANRFERADPRGIEYQEQDVR